LSSSIVPAMSMQFKAALLPKVKIPAGEYVVQSKIFSDEGTILDTARGSFTVGSSGLAPMAAQTPVTTSEPKPTPKEPTTPAPDAPMATLPPPKPPVNWTLIGGVAGGLVVMGLFIFFVLRWKARG
jgi:hypothetical protein